jgi:peptidoglycan/LPS O-acetylase OafA/YrhL
MLASSQKPVFRDLANLDFIRSFAVLLVVGSHLLSYTNHGKYSGWSGMTGVCIFFVHTSLVLMFSMERDPHIGRFYLRRIFRIYPLWLVVLAGVLIFHPSIDTGFPVNPRHVTLVDTLAQMTLTPNLFGLGTVYVPAGWTLPLEVQMYIFLPVLFFLVRSRNQLWVLMVIDVFIMAYDRANLPAFYSGLPMCVPYFLPGVMAFVLWKRAKKMLPGWLLPIALLALVAVDWKFGSFRNSWGFCAILGLSLPFFQEMSFRPFNRACHVIARYSYGIYLSHFFAILVAVHELRNYSMPVRIGGFLAVFLVVPFVEYHLLEEPMIRLGAKLARKIESGPAPRIDERLLSLEPAP